MLATKAFGMGVDISDIKNVWHFAALYHYDKRDFHHMKTLHRLFAIKNYQLVEMLKKICELHCRRGRKKYMPLDAENFSYIFEPTDDNDGVDKVKLALLTVQKDFELRTGFAPLRVRPCPMYAKGFFKFGKATQANITRNYGDCLTATGAADIFSVNLKTILDGNFTDVNFPQFKRMIYIKDNALPAELQRLQAALRVTVKFKKNFRENFKNFADTFNALVNKLIRAQKFVSADDLPSTLRAA